MTARHAVWFLRSEHLKSAWRIDGQRPQLEAVSLQSPESGSSPHVWHLLGTQTGGAFGTVRPSARAGMRARAPCRTLVGLGPRRERRSLRQHDGADGEQGEHKEEDLVHGWLGRQLV